LKNVRLVQGRPADLERLLPLVAAYHAVEGMALGADEAAAVDTLLADPRLGEIRLVELDGDLVGYVAVCFGYSLEFGGRDAFVDELYLAPRARGRGIGRHVLETIAAALQAAGIRALHLEVDRDNQAARHLYAKAGFAARERYHLMTRRLPKTPGAA
jgi:ribosomal protein S18 acetylase RimI-like enzyme